MTRIGWRSGLAIGVFLLGGCNDSGQLAAQNPTPDPVHAKASPVVPVAGRPVPLPARYVADRFYVEPVTDDGAPLRFLTSTGGALLLAGEPDPSAESARAHDTMFAREKAKELGLSPASIDADGRPTEVVLLPPFVYDAWIPKVNMLEGRAPVADGAEVKAIAADIDGLLGQGFFRDRVLSFDYLGRALLLRADADLPKHEAAHRAYLGFAKDAAGKRTWSYPRIEITVDGEKLSMLLHTGAGVALSRDALAKLGADGPLVRGTSFIGAGVFERWAGKHPQWRVLEEAEDGSREPMIEVPTIRVGGFDVGPVWFTRRPDASLKKGLSELMDQPVDGALGGSALRFFCLTIDYLCGFAVFEQKPATLDD